ncbi:inlA, partial [Symbiodinium pilosum]
CYFAKHHHTSQEADDVGMAAADVGEKFNAQLLGCVADPKRGSENTCTEDTRVDKQRAAFPLVVPDWQGGVHAELLLRLIRSDGPQWLPSEVEPLALRRGAPMVSDVLVHLSGELEDDQREELVEQSVNSV